MRRPLSGPVAFQAFTPVSLGSSNTLREGAHTPDLVEYPVCPRLQAVTTLLLTAAAMCL
jgi:hypothetical protein